MARPPYPAIVGRSAADADRCHQGDRLGSRVESDILVVCYPIPRYCEPVEIVKGVETRAQQFTRHEVLGKPK